MNVHRLPPALAPSNVSFHLTAASRSAGPSLTGAEQVVTADTGVWRASVTFPMVRREWILAFRAFIASLDGRAGITAIPVFDGYPAADIAGRALSAAEAGLFGNPNGNEGLFDHSGWGQTDEPLARAAAPAAIGSSRITVTGPAPWTIPRPGQYFGLGGRLYISIRSYRADEESPWTVDFRPLLREAVTAEQALELARPSCPMRLASDDEGAMSLAMSRWADSVSVSFTEAL